MIFIDTQIWIFAQKKPKKEKFQKISAYNNFLGLHNDAKVFLEQKLQTEDIAITYHQLGEIYHSLAFRGNKLKREFCLNYCNQLIEAEFVNLYPITSDQVKQCIRISCDTGIHVWDYMCIIPIIHTITEIFSCDTHFQHDSFKEFGKTISNPLNAWMTL